MNGRLLLLSALVALTAACGIQQGGTGGEGNLEDDSGGSAETSVPFDSGTPVLDEGLPLEEVSAPDTSIVPDTTVPDGGSPDTFVPDTFVPDTFVPDTFVPDTSVPDTFVPDTFVPDTFVPDTFVPDTFVPDTFVPDTFVPDTFVPDTAVVDTFVPDTAVGPACTEPGGKVFGGHCYFALAGPYTQSAAKTACTGRGAHIVAITSAAENTFVATIGTGDRWIGLAATSMVSTKSSYSWSTGEAVSYDGWSTGEPNSTGGCVRMLATGGKWGNWYCTEDWPVLCERD